MKIRNSGKIRKILTSDICIPSMNIAIATLYIIPVPCHLSCSCHIPCLLPPIVSSYCLLFLAEELCMASFLRIGRTGVRSTQVLVEPGQDFIKQEGLTKIMIFFSNCSKTCNIAVTCLKFIAMPLQILIQNPSTNKICSTAEILILLPFLILNYHCEHIISEMASF